MGMLTVRKILQGDVLLTEKPLLVLSKDKNERKRRPGLLEQFESLSQADKDKILSLHHENPHGSVRERLMGIFEANSIEVNPENCVALYPTIPR